MQFNRTTLLIILGVVILLVAVGSGVYFAFLREAPSRTLPPSQFSGGGLGNNASEGTSTTSALILVSDGWPTSISFDPATNQLRYFDQTNDQFRNARLDVNQVGFLSKAKFQNVTRALWSPTANQVILFYTSGLGTQSASFIDIGADSTTVLNNSIKEVAWSPSGKKIIVYVRDDTTNKNYIAIENPDGTHEHILLNTKMRDFSLFWPSTSTALILEKPIPGIPNWLFSLDTTTSQLKKVFDSLFGLEINPSPNGKLMVVSHTDQGGATINSEVDSLGGTLAREIPLPVLAERCAWAQNSETIYCAVFNGSSVGFSLPFDFWNGLYGVADAIVKFETKTSDLQALSALPPVSVEQLFVSAQEDYLSFLSRGDGALYSLRSTSWQEVPQPSSSASGD